MSGADSAVDTRDRTESDRASVEAWVPAKRDRIKRSAFKIIQRTIDCFQWDTGVKPVAFIST